jgi:hypothetical protein
VNSIPREPEGPGARQQQVDDQADDDRGQAQERVQRDDRCAPPGKAADRDRGAEGQSHGAGEDRRGEADFQREHDDVPEPRIAAADQAQREAEAREDFTHARL